MKKRQNTENWEKDLYERFKKLFNLREEIYPSCNIPKFDLYLIQESVPSMYFHINTKEAIYISVFYDIGLKDKISDRVLNSLRNTILQFPNGETFNFPKSNEELDIKLTLYGV